MIKLINIIHADQIALDNAMEQLRNEATSTSFIYVQFMQRHIA